MNTSSDASSAAEPSAKAVATQAALAPHAHCLSIRSGCPGVPGSRVISGCRCGYTVAVVVMPEIAALFSPGDPGVAGNYNV